jgi:hypothetical protein
MAAVEAIPEVAYVGRPVDRSEFVAAGQEPEPGRNKPTGGLWLSPVRRDGGRMVGTAWTEWCERHERHPARAPKETAVSPVRLAASARVAVISGPEDFAALAAAAGTRAGRAHALAGPVELDWAGVAVVADAVWLTKEGLYNLGGWGEPFYWWDVETVVVLNASALGPARAVD